MTVSVAEVNTPEVKKSERIIYEQLPELKHTFREPEPRPPQLISDAFAILCLAPILLLFILVCFFCRSDDNHVLI